MATAIDKAAAILYLVRDVPIVVSEDTNHGSQYLVSDVPAVVREDANHGDLTTPVSVSLTGSEII